MSTRQVVIDVPEKVMLAASSDEDDFARILRTSAAVKMYELGRLSSGRAGNAAQKTGRANTERAPTRDAPTIAITSLFGFRLLASG
jgi:hypothetical protein